MKSALRVLPVTVAGFFLLAISLFLGGCYSQVLLDAQNVQRDNTKDIVVLTDDGRRMDFAGGSYSVHSDTTGQLLLQGSGRVLLPASSQDEPYSGGIRFDEIRSIHSSEKSALFYVSLILGGAATVAAIWLMVAFGSGRGIAG
jgi:hypothetical protein